MRPSVPRTVVEEGPEANEASGVLARGPTSVPDRTRKHMGGVEGHTPTFTSSPAHVIQSPMQAHRVALQAQALEPGKLALFRGGQASEVSGPQRGSTCDLGAPADTRKGKK